jgi:hypothetical protein
MQVIKHASDVVVWQPLEFTVGPRVAWAEPVIGWRLKVELTDMGSNRRPAARV